MPSDARSLRIAIAQTNPTIGALRENREQLAALARRASEQGAQVVVFPELALIGYPPKDLLERPSFVAAQRRALDELAREIPAGLAAMVGFVDEVDAPFGPRLRNAVAILRDGAVERVVHKRLLPNYDVFDEMRWFAPGERSALVEVDGVRLGLTVCEDAWNDVPTPLSERTYADDPVAEVVERGAQIVLNFSASPFTRRKRHGRAAMLADIARKHGRPVLAVNQVGAHDDLIFDGASSYFDADGRQHVELASFAEDFAVVSLAEPPVRRPQAESDEVAVLDALALGVRDYVRRSGLRGALIGLSGGIDSALVACVATRALGPDAVVGLAMPTRYSSQHSLDDAADLASALGIRHRVVSIDAMFQAGIDSLAPHLDALGPVPPGDLTFENMQARIRCQTLMAASNRLGLMLLNTGNKSEIACGYCTLYGDMAGGLSVIGDLFKTFVYRVSHAVNAEAGTTLIPTSTLVKPPSAELRPDQKDSDSLPEYDVLDRILEAMIERRMGIEELVDAGHPRDLVERVARLVRISEHKRRQLPPTLVVTGKAFAIGRRHPIAQGWPG